MLETIKERNGWIIAGCAALMAIMMMSGWRAASGPASAPDSYVAICAACGYETRIDVQMVAQLGFARMHPREFRVNFPDIESPLGQQCAACGVFHSDFALAVDPRTGNRFVILRDADTSMPTTQEALAAVSPF